MEKPLSARPTRVGIPSPKAAAKAKYLNERFAQGDDALALLYNINRDTFYQTVAAMSNLELRDLCSINERMKKLCRDIEFWKTLWKLRFPNIDNSAETVDQLRAMYYDYNFADRLLKRLGPNQEKKKVFDAASVKDKSIMVHTEARNAVSHANILINLRNRLRKRTLEELIRDFADPKSDLDYDKLLAYAIDSDNLELFVYSMNKIETINEDNIVTLVTEDHSKLVSSFINVANNSEYFFFITQFFLRDLISLNKESENCNASDIAARLEIRILIPQAEIDDALDAATNKECTEVIELLSAYDPPTVEEELQYILDYVNPDHRGGQGYKLPRWATLLDYRVSDIGNSNQKEYVEFLTNLIVEENKNILYFLSNATPKGNLFGLCKAFIDTPAIHRWGIAHYLFLDEDNNVILPVLLVDGIRDGKIDISIIRELRPRPLNRDYEILLGRIRRAAPTDEVTLQFVEYERELLNDEDVANDRIEREELTAEEAEETDADAEDADAEDADEADADAEE